MRTAILVSLAVLLGLMLAACDERDTEKPDMEFTSDRDTLISLEDSLNFCNLTVTLTGDDGVTIDEKINFTYDQTMGQLFGDGSELFVYTDSSGVATAMFKVDENAAGPIMINAAMERFSSVNENTVLYSIGPPSLELSTDQSNLINTDPETNHCLLTVVLDGYDLLTQNEKIDFIYNDDMALLVGDGSDYYVYTDESGVATAEFIVFDDAAGAMAIEAVMDRFSSIRDTLTLNVIDTPNMLVYATEDSTAGDGMIDLDVTVELNSGSDNISMQNVLFTCDLPLAAAALLTDDTGQCVNQISATNVTPGTYTLHVSLESFPLVEKTIYFQLTNP